ncbi:hypothetical protein [Nocardia sp. alder85J]|uniref:hypothetical protein n=1 Tax=Nocardia sp. alder85J TaxID=2862949 RepID=UPI001CD237E8|nr:hypothetical protein [Nocardia sp. alder85J]MCX4095925.1 hypothetical protein [Nocardia sp. alder85J]
MRAVRDVVDTVTVWSAAVVAGLTLTIPLKSAWMADRPLQVDLMIFDVPRATAAGSFAAVIAVAVTVTLGHPAGRIGALIATVVLLVDRLLLHGAGTESLTTLNYLDSIFGGVLLGAIGAVGWRRYRTAAAYLFGGLLGAELGDLAESPIDRSGMSPTELVMLQAPSVLAVAAVGALLVAAIVTHRHDVDSVNSPLGLIPSGPLLAAVIVIPGVLLTSEWLVRSGDRSPVVVAATGLVVLAAVAAALVLPGREGIPLLLAVAFSAAGSALVLVPRPDWALPVPIGCLALGLYAGHRRPSPGWAAIALVALGLAGSVGAVIEPRSFVMPLLGCAAATFAVGYAFASAAPVYPTSIVVALAVLVVPSAGMAMRGRYFGRLAYSPYWYRSSGVAQHWTAGVVAAAVAAGCGLGVVLVDRRRAARSAGHRAAPALASAHPPRDLIAIFWQIVGGGRNAIGFRPRTEGFGHESAAVTAGFHDG